MSPNFVFRGVAPSEQRPGSFYSVVLFGITDIWLKVYRLEPPLQGRGISVPSPGK